MDDQKRLTEIIKVKGNEKHLLTDVVIRETTLTLIVNGYKLVSLACLSDDKLIELGFGYLLSAGIISNLKGVKKYIFQPSLPCIRFQLDITDTRLLDVLTESTKVSGCGGGITYRNTKNNHQFNQQDKAKKKFDSFPFDPYLIPDLMLNFQNHSQLFIKTGGVHSAALVDNKKVKIIEFANDIGRHNAVDKVIGSAIRKNYIISECSLLTTGRVSFEIMHKITIMGIPVLISHSAPTSKAISIAYQLKIFLIGFARGNRYNVYTGLDEFPQV